MGQSGNSLSSRSVLQRLFKTAIAAAHPSGCLPPHLPRPPAAGRLILLAAGKAAGAMTETAERHYLDNARCPPSRLTGLAVTRHGYGRPTRLIEGGSALRLPRIQAYIRATLVACLGPLNRIAAETAKDGQSGQ